MTERWTFDGSVSVGVRLEVESPATWPEDRAVARQEYEAARDLAKQRLREVAAGLLEQVAVRLGGHGWSIEELESDGPTREAT